MDNLGDTDLLVRNLVSHQDRMYRYIFSLCPHHHDAMDILQEASVALLRQASAFDANRPFLPWAFRFAQLEVLKHRERVSRNRRVFDADVIELLAKQRQGIDERLHAQLADLDDCVAALGPTDRELVERRYTEQADMSAVAHELGMARRTLFRNLQRVRRLLLDCLAAKHLESPR